MPEIVVYAAEGRSVEQKKKLLKAITQAVVDSFEIEADVVTVSIIETPKHHKSKGGVPFDER
ncbi:tautomerase family protein [uncultured Pantoea sp.]|uniref:tautomerase family protein n=1 Tax=uncultured Pantoea sp. TaxID=218084 RepID=UPI00258B17AE|nr:tautomerase family protein [uncultured Pantoea sp.]